MYTVCKCNGRDAQAERTLHTRRTMAQRSGYARWIGRHSFLYSPSCGRAWNCEACIQVISLALVPLQEWKTISQSKPMFSKGRTLCR